MTTRTTPAGTWHLLSGAVKGIGKRYSQDHGAALAVAGGRAVVLAVADGHGSAPHFRSDLGARWAVEEFTACAEAFASAAVQHGDDATRLPWLRAEARALPRQFTHRWRQRALLHDCNSPAHGEPPRRRTDGDSPDLTAYGSTLVGAVLTPGLVVCWQLGDGDVVLVPEGGTPGTPLFTGPEMGDETESLCRPEAWRATRLHWQPLTGDDAPCDVLLSTDGLSKSFTDHQGFLDFVTGVRNRAVEQGLPVVRAQLGNWLARAAAHSGDDTTLVGALVDSAPHPHRNDDTRSTQSRRDSMVNGMLAAGQTLVTEEGEKVTVAELFGSGGQGEVYRVRTRNGDRAAKWYYPQLADTRQRRILDGLIDRGWADDRFLWPRSIVTSPDSRVPGFGYLMDVRPDRFHGLPELFRRDPSVSATTVRTLVTAALHTVEAYRTLHSRGIAYRDINWGNVFFDPATGDVLICDNDNAVVEGEDAGVAGTMDFMAPELVRQEQGVQPGIQTDLHSLAVLLFLLLMNHHPLDGALALGIRCMDEPAKRKLYGTDPVFVYDPADARNRPVPGEQPTVIATWRALPKILQDLFVATFTRGLRNPGARVRESQWRDALSRVLDAVTVCRSCGRQNMTEPDGPAPQCWKCGRTLVLPPLLTVTTGTGTLRTHRGIRLEPHARVYAHHLAHDPDRHDFTAVVGEVTEHPRQPGRFGLTNRTASAWTVRRDDGKVQDVLPGRTVGLRAGLLLEFGGGTEAVVRD